MLVFFAMSLLRFFIHGPFLSFQSLRITLWVIKTYPNPVQLLLGDSSQFSHICWDACIWIQMKILLDYTFWAFVEFFPFWRGNMFSIFFLSLQTELFSHNHCLRRPCSPQESNLFMWAGVSGSFWKILHWSSFLIGNFLKMQSDVPKRPSKLLEQFSLTQTHVHTYRQPEREWVRALQTEVSVSEGNYHMQPNWAKENGNRRGSD